MRGINSLTLLPQGRGHLRQASSFSALIQCHWFLASTLLRRRPSQPIDKWSRVSTPRNFPIRNVKADDIAGHAAGHIRERTIRTCHDFVRILRQVDRSNDLHTVEIDDGNLRRRLDRDHEPPPIAGRRQPHARSRQWNPVFYAACCGINDRQARLGLICRKDPSIVCRNRDPLRFGGYGDDAQ